MFQKELYVNRRKQLINQVKSGVLLFLGNEESSMNYPANPFRFRQDSTFLYYWGLDFPGLAAIIDVDNGREIIFGDDYTIDDIVWMGSQMTMKEKAHQIGVKETKQYTELGGDIEDLKKSGKQIHYLPQYRPENLIKIEALLGIKVNTVNQNISTDFIKAVVAQRSIKSDAEIKEIEYALSIAYEMHTMAMERTGPGIYEREIAGAMEGIANTMGQGLSFPIIFSIHGETLHNHYHGNLMNEGDIVVNDSGAESFLHYASDITRTIPVKGTFTPQQKEIYEIVLHAQLSAIDSMKPGVKFRDVHLLVAKVITKGLKELGFLKGDIDEAVSEGAHALFFPHGLGHMMGLDVHDMESLGEDFVGYDDNTRRSDQFGLAYLRMGKELKPGHVITVEPGIYFIPELIDLWREKRKFLHFIDYEKVEKYKSFGGIRIEDDVLVTEKGHRVLGKPIPKNIREVEDICSG
jgi:Xaa-Pro dipeptidase